MKTFWDFMVMGFNAAGFVAGFALVAVVIAPVISLLMGLIGAVLSWGREAQEDEDAETAEEQTTDGSGDTPGSDS